MSNHVDVCARASLTACFRAHAPSFVVVQASSGLIALFLRLPGCTTSEGLDFAGSFVYQIKDASIAKFKQLEGMKADELQLFKIDGGIRTLLGPTQSLSEAGVVACTSLAMELTFATQASLAGAWNTGGDIELFPCDPGGGGGGENTGTHVSRVGSCCHGCHTALSRADFWDRCKP